MLKNNRVEEKKPPGFGFFPTHYELVKFYLYPKVHSLPFNPDVVTDVELYKYHPAELAELYKDKGEKAWYFFTPRERKYKNGTRPNRAVKENQEGQGFWKATGRDKEIKEQKTKAVIALKKTLVYHEKTKSEIVKTNWIMQEYTMPASVEQSESSTAIQGESSDMRLDDWVLCKIYLNFKGTKKRRKEEQEEEANNNATKHPLIEEDATNKGYNMDEEISKFMEDGYDEFLIEDQAVLSNPMAIPTLPTATNNHRPLLTEQSGTLRYVQQNVRRSQSGYPAMQVSRPRSSSLMPMQANGLLSNGLLAMQASRSQSNQKNPMQVIESSGFSTPNVQLGGRSRFGNSLLPHNQQQNFEFSPSQTTRIPNASLEPIQSSDQIYALESMQMMQFNATRNSMIKVENFPDICWPLHSQFDSFTSQMPPLGKNFQSLASFDEPQLAPFPDSLDYYESQINAEESIALETPFEQGIDATGNEVQFIVPRALLRRHPLE
ncbi:hypothetical protein ACLOJK_024912 [Asimina triloba]